MSRVFEEVFIRFGLPYKVVGGVRFYERKEVRDALAYLRAVANEDDTVSVRRVLNTPKRGIGERAEACIEALAGRERISFGAALRRVGEATGISTRAANSVTEFVAMLDAARELAETGTPEEVLEVAAPAQRLPHRAGGEPRPAGRRPGREPAGTGERRPRVHRAHRGQRPAADDDADAGAAAAAPVATLDGFLEQVSLVADADQIPADDPEHKGVVTLMTLHTAKGLEFPVVFLTGLEDGVFPHLRALGDRKELEEERRLAYVGITRARQRLYISRVGHPLGVGPAAVQPALALPRGAAARPGPLGAHAGRVHQLVRRWRASAGAAATVRRGQSSFVGGTPKAAELAGRLGIDPSKLATASDLKANVPALAVGDRVNHQRYGVGRVLQVEGYGARAQAQVDFGDQVMWIVLRHAPIEKL